MTAVVGTPKAQFWQHLVPKQSFVSFKPVRTFQLQIVLNNSASQSKKLLSSERNWLQRVSAILAKSFESEIYAFR